ncbi:MAG: electron transport complex subunit RsxG [Methylotenera sp.]|nr:electron transport complex subunit RsxG [Methylotenera sp.]MSP99700.1 electron transport complex subunit RsxG [Methylotenera sp.]
MLNNAILKNALKTTITMLTFAFVGTLLLAYVFDITRAPIEASEKEARLALFKQIMPENSYDNELLKAQVAIAPNDLLGNRLPTIANIAKLNHKTVGVILEAVAHNGYSGDIKVLIAIRADGSISGVRVLAHKETPGLGDYIDIARGNWIKLFNNESVQRTPAEKWQVKKDGGKFDYMVGATITPRAVVEAVLKALQFYEINKQSIFAVNAEIV